MQTLNIKKIQPTKGYVLVEPAKAEEKTVSGIILPENESEKPQYGVVLAVGEACDCGDSCSCEDGCDCGCGCEEKKETDVARTYKKQVKENWSSCNCDSCTCEAPVKVGDKVIYKKWGGNEFKIDDIEYQFLKFEDILAIIK